MAKQKTRHNSPATATPFEEARDELFQHIMRCGVVGAEPEHQKEWFSNTIGYLAERFPELGEQQLSELQKLGERFAQPPKRREEAESAA